MSEAIIDIRLVQLRDGTWRAARDAGGFRHVCYGATADEAVSRVASELRRDRIGDDDEEATDERE